MSKDEYEITNAPSGNEKISKHQEYGSIHASKPITETKASKTGAILAGNFALEINKVTSKDENKMINGPSGNEKTMENQKHELLHVFLEFIRKKRESYSLRNSSTSRSGNFFIFDSF